MLPAITTACVLFIAATAVPSTSAFAGMGRLRTGGAPLSPPLRAPKCPTSHHGQQVCVPRRSVLGKLQMADDDSEGWNPFSFLEDLNKPNDADIPKRVREAAARGRLNSMGKQSQVYKDSASRATEEPQVKEPEPVMEEPRPVVKEPEPVMEEPKPKMSIKKPIKKVMGSKRLGRIKELAGGEKIESDKRLLGSRRLRAIIKTLVNGVADVEEPTAEASPPPPASVEVSTEKPKQAVTAPASTEASSSELKTNTQVEASASNTQVEASASASEVKTDTQAEASASDTADNMPIPSAKTEAVQKTIEIAASVEECFEAAAGFEDYPKWAASVAMVDVIEKTSEGLGQKVAYEVGAFGRNLGYTLAYKFEYPKKIAWYACAGSVKELVGSYEFEDGGNGKTRVNYNLAIDPGFPLPSLVKQASAKLIVSTALNELRKYSEKEDTRSRMREIARNRNAK